jgi:hypothetical protein
MLREDLGEPPVVLRIETREEAAIALDEVVLPAAERGVTDSEHVSVWTLVSHVLHPSTPVGPPCGWPWRSNRLEAWIGPFAATAPGLVA